MRSIRPCAKIVPFVQLVLAGTVLAASISLAAPTPSSSPASAPSVGPYSAIITFGDSFSDNGNGAWVISNHTWPANPHYYGGRFSNGPVWIEYVAGNLSVPLVDYATGGATSSNTLVQGYTGPNSTISVPSIDEQVARFLKDGVDSNVSLSMPLFAILGGANDPLFNPNITAAQSFQALMASKAQLAAKYPDAGFLFLDYPELSRLPYDFYVDARTRTGLRRFSRELNALYHEKRLRSVLKGERFKYIDIMPLFADWGYYGMPSEYGFAPLGAYGSCLTGAYGETANVTVCDDPDAKAFWDEYHPSTHAHSWIARLVLDELHS